MEERSIQSMGGEARAKALSPGKRSQIATMAAAKRWNIPYATHKGILDINGIKIQCYVLENGKRVLSQTGTIKALGMMRGSSRRAAGAGARMADFMGGVWLKPFISNELVPVLSNPYEFVTPSGSKAFAYEATILVDICDAVVQARRQGTSTTLQKRLAERCDILIRGFAKVGITALVDEATGYQEIRDRLALQEILDKYLRHEYAKWAKRFPDDFYKLLFQLRGWQWNPMSVKRPGVVGKYTDDLVYARLAPGVREELRRLNPPDEKGHRKTKHHQWLTEDIGHPALQRHIDVLLVLMRIAGNWAAFQRMVDKAFPRLGRTYEIPFEGTRDRWKRRIGVGAKSFV